jgi:hypothetical protein
MGVLIFKSGVNNQKPDKNAPASISITLAHRAREG